MDGYKILDFKGVNIEDGETVEGIYKAIDESTKPLVVTNIKLPSPMKDVKPFFSSFVKLSTSGTTLAYVTTVFADDSNPFTIYVNDDDTITNSL